ncbi:MAG: signal peptidase II [Deltaproteobacteria bacterium]|nr:signal peptidase II [Deltaproteobacteria bacterium]
MNASDTQHDIVPAAPAAFAETSEHRRGVDGGPDAPRWAKLLLLPAVVSMTVTLDQGSKLIAQKELAEARQAVPYGAAPGSDPVKIWMPVRKVTVVEGLFDLRYVENPAAAFSLTASLPEWIRKPFLVVVSMLAMFLILTWYWRTREPDWLILTCFALILGGALGNLIDRMSYGYVIDFIDWHLSTVNPGWPHWPTFNIADSAICVGAGGVILRTFRPWRGPAPARAPAGWHPRESQAMVDGQSTVPATDPGVEPGAPGGTPTG